MRADLATLREPLTSGAVTNLETSSRQEKRPIRNADGFRRLRQGGKGEDSVVRAQVFTDWFGTPTRVRSVSIYVPNGVADLDLDA